MLPRRNPRLLRRAVPRQRGPATSHAERVTHRRRTSQRVVASGRAAVVMDTDKIDEAVLALLHLTLHDGARAWKGHDWDALGRLHNKGMILDPVGKAKSVVLTEQGE